MCIYIYIHIRTGKCHNIYICMYMCLYIYIYIYIYLCMNIDRGWEQAACKTCNIHKQVKYECVPYIHAYTCILPLSTYMYVYVYTYIYLHIITYIYLYIYIYMHMHICEIGIYACPNSGFKHKSSAWFSRVEIFVAWAKYPSGEMLCV